MTSDDKTRRVEVKDGDQPVAAAEVAEHAEGIVRTSLLPSSGHTPPGSRASLVDAVMDTPEVQASSRLEATVPLGDAESLERLRERTEDAVTRQAGSTALLDANIPSGSQPGSGQDPDGGTRRARSAVRSSRREGIRDLGACAGGSLSGRGRCGVLPGHRAG